MKSYTLNKIKHKSKLLLINLINFILYLIKCTVFYVKTFNIKQIFEDF